MHVHTVHMYVFNMPEIIYGENTDWYVCTFTQTYGAINCAYCMYIQEYTDLCTSVHFHETCSNVHMHKRVLACDMCVHMQRYCILLFMHTNAYIRMFMRIHMNVLCTCIHANTVESHCNESQGTQ